MDLRLVRIHFNGYTKDLVIKVGCKFFIKIQIFHPDLNEFPLTHGTFVMCHAKLQDFVITSSGNFCMFICSLFDTRPLSVLIIGPLGTNFTQIWIKIQFPFQIHVTIIYKMVAILFRPQCVNSLAPGTFEWNFKWVIFMINSVIDGWCISGKIALRWESLDLSDDKSTLVQVVAWCRQAASHYLSQCWPRSVSLYGVTRPQWVNPSHS